MMEPGPRLASINELRFCPANSNDRARAGMEHAFRDVPDCSFAKDDGISPYMAADAGIKDFPDTPARHSVLHGDVPTVTHAEGTPTLSLGAKMLRSGFGLSVFLHVLVAGTIGYFTTVPLPGDTLLEGETVIAIEFFSETDSEVTTRAPQVDQEGEEEAVEQAKLTEPVETPKEEPKEEAVEPVKPVEKPVEVPQTIEQPVVVVDQPEVLSTTQPSDFQIEAAAKQILEETRIEPLPDTPPPMLVLPVEEKEPEPEMKAAQPLAHPVSKPRVVEKVAEVKPVEVKPVETPVVKKEEPKPVVKKEETKPVEKKPEPKKVEPKKDEAKKPDPDKKVRKKTVARDGNAESDSNKGSSTAQNKKGASQDASQGNSKNRLKGNSSKSNYKGLVQRKLERAKKRVPAAGKGSVTVGFTINANGSVSNLRIKKSSGKPALDKAALDVVRRASPFPAIPSEEGRSSWPMTVPMTFRGR